MAPFRRDGRGHGVVRDEGASSKRITQTGVKFVVNIGGQETKEGTYNLARHLP